MDESSPVRVIVLVSFVLVGADLDPETITDLLGLQPTRARRRGEVIRSHPSSVYPTGSWSLQSDLHDSEPIEAHVTRLLDHLEGKGSEIRSLIHSGLDGGFYCTYAMQTELNRILLSSATLARIANLNLDLTIDTSCEGESAGEDGQG